MRVGACKPRFDVNSKKWHSQKSVDSAGENKITFNYCYEFGVKGQCQGYVCKLSCAKNSKSIANMDQKLCAREVPPL